MKKLTFCRALAPCRHRRLLRTAPFFSLRNTDFVVLLAFLLFIAVLVYVKVPG